LYTEIKEGRGPTITRVTARRSIIQDQHWDPWLEQRQSDRAGPDPIKRSAQSEFANP
jgi:hypothetical protein